MVSTGSEQEISFQLRVAANEALRKLFEVPQDFQAITPNLGETRLLYGKNPDKTLLFKTGSREFGAEIYLPSSSEDKRKVWIVAQHGYGGRARDFSKLAELLNKDGIGVFSLDMHVSGKDDFERMSMKTYNWARVAIAAARVLHKKYPESAASNIIFVGQSSGGSAGFRALELYGHPFEGALLIAPTLVTPDPELVGKMDKTVARFTVGQRDFLLDWGWMGLISKQMNDEVLNKAYLAYLTSTPGMPYFAVREAYAIPEGELLDWTHNIHQPVFAVKGEFDSEDPTSLAALAQKLSHKPNPKVNIKPDIAGAGHQAHIEKPEEVAKLVNELVEAI